ncbi:hypothetical protein [Sphaerisporangium dianthi]|uniref:Uncharacterized protein n=1 Tax=Sphaerisporangium dianthi TaxID=1436120 RepID=A0ABV9CU01_9ACTN
MREVLGEAAGVVDQHPDRDRLPALSGDQSRKVPALQALRASGLPDERIPARYHRMAVLIVALIASEAGVGTITPEEILAAQLAQIEAEVRPG